MKKEDILSYFVYLILIAAAFVVTFTIGAQFQVDFMSRFWFALLTIIIAVIFNITLLELLHCLGGKLGGYEVVYINVFGFGFQKIKNKWVFKYEDFDGLGGEVRLCPKKEKTNLKPFIWLPLVGYIIEFALGFTLISLVNSQEITAEIPEWLGFGSLLFIIIATCVALYNLIPTRLDTLTDGYRLLLISNPTNKEAYDELMVIENHQRNGEEVGDIKTFDFVSEFTSKVNLLAIYEDVAKKEFDKSLEIIEKMFAEKNKLSDLINKRLMAQKLYILLMTDKEKASEYYESAFKDAERRFVANDSSIETLRAYVLVAGLLDDSQSEVSIVIKHFKKALKDSLESRSKIEQSLFDEAINKILAEKPDWKKEDLEK